MNFEEIVLCYLEEANASPSGVFKQNSIGAYILDPSSNFRKTYDPFFVSPDETTLEKMITMMERNWTRQSDKSFAPFAKYFVVFDFLAYCYEKSSKSVQASPKMAFFADTAKKIYPWIDGTSAAFFKNKHLFSDPLEINTSSAFGMKLQLGLKMISSDNLGKEVFKQEAYQKLNIEQALYAFVAARQNNRKKILNLDKIPAPSKEITNLILTSDVAGGKKPIPTDALNKYSENFSRELMFLGVAARQLWEFEQQKYSVNQTANTFENFIKNVPLTQNVPSTNPISSTPSKITAYTFATSSGPIYASNEKDPGDGGYIIKNIIEMSESGKNNAARNFMDKLYSFADYIHQGESLAGRFQKAAQGTASALKSISSALGPTPGM